MKDIQKKWMMVNKMKIKELKDIIDKAYENGRGCDVEFYLAVNEDESFMVDIDYIGQFNVIPDMTIRFTLTDDSIDLKSKKLNAKTVDYKKKYRELKNKLDKIKNILYEEDE